MMRFRTSSSDDTQSLAATLAKLASPCDLVLLTGEIGAGKTTFAKGFGAALGVKEQITSPTFVLLRSYEATVPLHHADIYRLERLQEVIDLGLMELLDEGGVALVEWGDMAAPVLPRDFLDIRLEVDDMDHDARNIEVHHVGPAWSARQAALCSALDAWRMEGDEQR